MSRQCKSVSTNIVEKHLLVLLQSCFMPSRGSDTTWWGGGDAFCFYSALESSQQKNFTRVAQPWLAMAGLLNLIWNIWIWLLFWRLPCKVADGALESFSFFHHLSFSCPAHGSMGGAQRNEESYVTKSDTCKHKSSLDSDGKWLFVKSN